MTSYRTYQQNNNNSNNNQNQNNNQALIKLTCGPVKYRLK